ncbi:MAG: hypothetical protein IPH53_22945 [Flavobacteriales bacterium]|nr:hypothetical protein [Flavobacteriales bacterium]
MVTTFVDKGDHYLLNGAKMWIDNSPRRHRSGVDEGEETRKAVFTD